VNGSSRGLVGVRSERPHPRALAFGVLTNVDGLAGLTSIDGNLAVWENESLG